MGDEPNQAQRNEPKKSSMLALLLAFMPSVLLISFATFAGRSGPPAVLCASLCLVSLACCFGSSFLLFQRNKVVATIFGILFLLLNGLISFFFGCATILTGMKF